MAEKPGVTRSDALGDPSLAEPEPENFIGAESVGSDAVQPEGEGISLEEFIERFEAEEGRAMTEGEKEVVRRAWELKKLFRESSGSSLAA